MGQIEKRKKKGRPSKADLAAATTAVEHRDIRRSLRRRSFRYNIIDYDEDYLDDDDDFVVLNDVVPTKVFKVDEDEDEDEDEVQVEVEDEVEVEVEERDSEDDEDDDEGCGKRREKKVKLVVKLTPTSPRSGSGSVRGRGGARGRPSRPGSASILSPRGRVVEDEQDEEDVEEQDEEDVENEEQERPIVKKRKVSASHDSDDDDEHDHNATNSPLQGRDFKVEAKREHSTPGRPAPRNQDSRTPLPDKKQLELILDKLQKKDTYGVYAEPVDPEELPDYHDIIKHPMDFSTVRKKLASGSYSTLEQFESDVFLISSNAMQYNAPDTIYHKQARAIKDLAERKFERVRIRIERLEKELKSEENCEKSESKPEQRERPNFLVKKLSKKPTCRSTQEPVGSDFSSGATLATTDGHNTCSADPVANFERHTNNDGPVEGTSFLVDNLLQKSEDLHSGKGIVPKFGKRSFVVDENRRATYNMPCQPVDRSDTIFIPFEDETKHLIPVGLPGEYAYARSLARYAANLGPIAWRIASKRIEQIIPPGFKYGRGWVGEYEPLPTTMLVLKGRKEYPFVSKLPDATHSGKNDKLPRCRTPEHLSNQPSADGKLSSMFGSGGAKPPTPTVSVGQPPNSFPAASAGPENMMLKRAGLSCLSPNNQSNGPVFQQQKQLRRDSVCTENMGAKRVEPNAPSMSNPKLNSAAAKQTPNGNRMDANKMEPNSVPVSTYRTDPMDAKQRPRGGSEKPTFRPAESAHEGKNFLQSFSSKQQDPTHGVAPEGLHNGKRKINNVADSNRVIVSTPGSIVPMQQSGVATSFPQRQDNGLSDPVLVMKMLTERQQNGSIHALSSPSPVRPCIPSPRGEGGSNAAASAWMSVGFRPAAATQTALGNRGAQVAAHPFHGGKHAFYPQTMQSHSQYPVSATMHFQPEKNGLPFQAFVQQQSKVTNEPHIHNRPVVGTNEASRFQVQTSWRGLSPNTQQKQKQDTLPPDLNVAFQSVDSQQPDLALQL